MLSDLDEMTLTIAIADARCPVPLKGDTRRLDANSVANVIRALRAEADGAKASHLLVAARLDREEWFRQCAEKDVENAKRRLAEMTEYRDNASQRLEWATSERDEARKELRDAREALRTVANCKVKGCCKNCRATAARYAPELPGEESI